MSGITLSAGIRANLLSLQNTASLMQTTQNDLATGKKVNSALDNPLEFFTSQSLNTRADALSGLLDSMSNGIQTIQAANNGLTSITALVQQLQSTASQAAADTTTTGAITPGVQAVTSNTSSAANHSLTFNVGGGVNVSVSTFSTAVTSTLASNDQTNYTTNESANNLIVNDGGGHTVTVTFTAGATTAAKKITQINTQLAAGSSQVTATTDSSGDIELYNTLGNTITVTGTAAQALGFANGSNNTSTNGSVAAQLTNQQLVDSINNNAALAGKVSADINATSSALEINNLQTSTSITVTGLNGAAITGAAADNTVIAKATGTTMSSVRTGLMNQYNNLLTQINQMASDAGYNGTNLLNGDALALNFNENGTSNMTVQMTDANGNKFAVNATSLGLNTTDASVFGNNGNLATLANTISGALTTLQTQATAISSSLSVVQTRQNFTNQMINTLQTGADNLVLADPNLEGANLLALQTRQSLSTTALSMASQAQQAVLRLFQ